MANQITIGRNPQNTIVVNAQYNTVSGSHATISRNGNTLTFEDHSTNGSYVNGQKVHHSSITIQQGDIITLGHQYTLNMNDVLRYMGGSRDTQRTPQVPGTAREIPTPIVRQEPQHAEAPAPKAEPNNLNSFNWGAFLLSWIWGCGNGIYWPLIVLIPGVGWVVGIVIPFVLGFNGNRMAWEKYNDSALAFEDKQASWTKGAWIYVICVFILSFIIGMLMGFAD